MKINMIRSFARFLLFMFLALMVLMFAGCRSKKLTVDKKSESVSELKQNDIQTSEKSISGGNTLRLSDSREWSFEPEDSSQPSSVVYGTDTLRFINARIVVKKDQVKESSAETSEVEKTTKDKSTSEAILEKKEKLKDKKVKSASWGVNLGIIVGIITIVIALFVHYKTKR